MSSWDTTLERCMIMADLSSPDNTGNTTDTNRRTFIKKASLLGAGLLMPPPGNTAAKENAQEIPPGPSDTAQRAPVSIPDVSIFMKSPDAELVGISSSAVIEIKLADVLAFHGYCAGGVAFAFRAAQEAFKILYPDTLPVRQSMKVYTSHHCCQAGALAYITGARTDFGALKSRGDLVLIPEEKKEMVFVDKKSGNGVTLRPLFNPHDIFKPLFQNVSRDHTLAPRVRRVLNEAVQQYVTAPVKDLFRVEQT